MTRNLIRSGLAIAIAVSALILIIGTNLAEDRDPPLELVVIGSCELPEDVTVADGWDVDPANGNWGGVDESEFAVAWAPGSPDLPELTGREAACTISGLSGWFPRRIRVHALNGLANDDYCVFVEIMGTDVRVGCYDETNPTEEWIATDFVVPHGFVAWGQDITVKVFATGNSWSGFNTWGQLAVDRIEILGLDRGHGGD